jgi:hypothetical protein
MLYLGRLEGLDTDGRSSLLSRIESLLMHRYDSEASIKTVETMACNFVAKYHSRQRGHSVNQDSLDIISGPITWDTEEERIILASFQTLCVREIGGEWLCWQAISELGIRSFLENTSGWSSTQTDVLLTNLVARMLYPVSERKTSLWLSETSGAGDLLNSVTNLTMHDLHQSNSKLLEVHYSLEDHLYDRMNELVNFGDVSFLYDLTNTYFEGKMESSKLAQFGRSKEKRSDCRLVSIGLLANELGFIRRSEFYSGNVSEPSTFEHALTLAGADGILTDAGIGTAENIEKAAQKELPYTCVVREKYARFEVDFTELDVFVHQPSNKTAPYRIWAQTKEHHFTIEGKEYIDYLVFVKSEAKKAKEDAMVNNQKKRMEEALTKLQQGISKPNAKNLLEGVQQRIGRLKERNQTAAKGYQITLEHNENRVSNLQWVYDKSIEQGNGVYVIRTSKKPSSAAETWKKYHAIANIEEVNRRCKTDLNMRPVYHQKDETIQTHLLLTLIACSITTYILHKLNSKGINWSWKEVVRVMNSQKVSFCEFKNNQKEHIMFSKWSEPEEKTEQIYKAMNYKNNRNQGFFFKVKVNDS